MTDAATSDPKTVNLADILAGRSFPTETVEIYMDEATAYEISKVNAEIEVAKGDTDDLEARREELIKKGAPSRLTIHLRGIPRHDRENIIRTVMDLYPQKRDFLGRPEPDIDADNAFTNLIWTAMIEKIEAEAGVVEPVGEDDVRLLRDNAPDQALTLISSAIDALTEGAKSGFEALAQEHDFLSRR